MTANYALLTNLLRERTIPNSIAIGVMALKAKFEDVVFKDVNFVACNQDFKVDLPINQAIQALLQTGNTELINDIKANLSAALMSEDPHLDIKAINLLQVGVISIHFNVK